MKEWPKRSAIKQALNSKHTKYQHGAVIEKSGRILGLGYNENKPKAPHYNEYSTHAEAAAIINAKEKHCLNATLYVCRLTANKINNSKPCERCMVHIIAAGIKRVVYTIDNRIWAMLEI